MSETTPNLKRTPLYELHRRLEGKLVPFAGYEMPVQYEGILAEHEQVRTAAGLFDVSHMGQAALRGPGAAAALEALVPGDIQALAAGRMRYTVLTNDKGGIIDDLMVTARGEYLHLVVNASRKDVDINHIRNALPKGVTLDTMEDRALLALQGPKAADVLARLAPPSRHMLFMTAEDLRVGDVPCLVTRSGYTGEDGFEISVPADQAEHLAELILDDSDAKPIGLGARDSLRLEAGLCLYGNDIDETTTPVEADLRWIINKRRREEGGFPGADIILAQLENGAPRTRVGIRPEGRTPARAHTEICDGSGKPVGEITSGGFGPTVQAPVAMGYVPQAFAAAGTAVGLIVRGKTLPARVEALPFVPHRYFKRK